MVPECPYVKLPTCTKTILEILGNYPEGMTRKSLREQMLRKRISELSNSESDKDNGERWPNHLGRQQIFRPINWFANRLAKKEIPKEESTKTENNRIGLVQLNWGR